jgi:hypothetical protein
MQIKVKDDILAGRGVPICAGLFICEPSNTIITLPNYRPDRHFLRGGNSGQDLWDALEGKRVFFASSVDF